jgi:hypothetical protein
MHISTIIAIVLASTGLSSARPSSAGAAPVNCKLAGTLGGGLLDVTQANGKFFVEGNQETYTSQPSACQAACLGQDK